MVRELLFTYQYKISGCWQDMALLKPVWLRVNAQQNNVWVATLLADAMFNK